MQSQSNEAINRMVRDHVTRDVLAELGKESGGAILIPPDVVSARVDAELVRRQVSREEQQARHANRVRAVLIQAMVDLDDELGSFEQTTHGHLGRGTFKGICDQMAVTYDNPSAFEISNLSQEIYGFLRQQNGNPE